MGRLPWSTWVLTRMSSGQPRMSSLLPLRLSSQETEESPRRRLLVPSLPGLTNKESPSHKKHGISWRLLSMKLMPMVMVSLPVRNSTLLSLRRKPLDQKERREERKESLSSNSANTEQFCSTVTYAADYQRAYTCYINTGFFNT